MRKLLMTAVMLCGALVTGCNGVVEEGAPATEASAGSAGQAVLSPELEAALACVETYVNAGTCDWAHWSELWETCRTYEHPELEDGMFIEAVQEGSCTAANWPTLRAQLVAPRVENVRVREDCNAASQVIQEAGANGCYTLAAGAGASYVDVPLGKAVTLHDSADCTGDSVTVETDTNLCETSFESGASANDRVRSFRVQDVSAPSSPYRYECAEDEPTCVQNFNRNLAAINKQHTVKVVRVTLAGRTTPSVSAITGSVNQLYDFYDVASRGQVSRNFLAAQTVQVTSSDCSTAKGQATRAVSSSAFMTVYMLPSGLCSASNAGAGKIFLKSDLFRNYAHEAGHILGLAHGNRLDAEGKVDTYGDASTYMGSMPSDNYNLPQLHWLGWTRKEELIKVNSAIDGGGSIEVTLRPVDKNADSTSGLPLGAVWEIPGTQQRLFVAIPKSRTTDVNQIEGGTVLVYRAPRCEGCTGMAMGTLQMGRFGAKNVNEHNVSGLIIRPVGYTSHMVQVDGRNVEVFTSVTLKLRR